MRYAAIVTKEGNATLAEFPDCPGCQTCADEGESIEAQALDALTGWLEATMDREAPPRPRATARAPRGGRVLWVEVPAQLAAKVELRWARQAAGLTQAQLAKLAGVSQQQIAKIERPDSNPTLATLEKVAKALNMRLSVGFSPVGSE